MTMEALTTNTDFGVGSNLILIEPREYELGSLIIFYTKLLSFFFIFSLLVTLRHQVIAVLISLSCQVYNSKTTATRYEQTIK